MFKNINVSKLYCTLVVANYYNLCSSYNIEIKVILINGLILLAYNR